MPLNATKVAGALPYLEGVINCGADQWAFALTNTIPSSPTFVAGTTDLATGGGYTQGGTNVTTTSASESAGTYKLILANPATWTASSSGFTFRYILLVNKTNNIVPQYWDYGSSVVMNGANADNFTFTPDSSNGVLTVI